MNSSKRSCSPLDISFEVDVRDSALPTNSSGGSDSLRNHYKGEFVGSGGINSDGEGLVEELLLLLGAGKATASILHFLSAHCIALTNSLSHSSSASLSSGSVSLVSLLVDHVVCCRTKKSEVKNKKSVGTLKQKVWARANLVHTCTVTHEQSTYV